MSAWKVLIVLTLWHFPVVCSNGPGEPVSAPGALDEGDAARVASGPLSFFAQKIVGGFGGSLSFAKKHTYLVDKAADFEL